MKSELRVKSLTSQDMQKLQDLVTILLKELIDQPMKNWALINKYQVVLKDVDTQRRLVWHDEKFGESEEIVDQVLDMSAHFTCDDIPF